MAEGAEFAELCGVKKVLGRLVALLALSEGGAVEAAFERAALAELGGGVEEELVGLIGRRRLCSTGEMEQIQSSPIIQL